MARKLFSRNEKRGTYVGHFPPPGGWKRSCKGIIRKLCAIKDIEHLSKEQQARHLQERYNQVNFELRNADLIEEKSKKRKDLEKRGMMFSAASKLWLKEVELTKNHKTVESYANTVQHYLKGVGDHSMKEFDKSKNLDFFDYLANKAEYRNKPLAKSTQNYHMRQLQVFVTWAFEEEILLKHIKLKKAPNPKKDMETFSLDDLSKLKAYIAKALTQEKRKRELLNLKNLNRAFSMATNTLMRIGAIDAMRLDWIDLENRVIRIKDNPDRKFENKKYKRPIKPMNDELYEFLVTDLKNRHPSEEWFLDNGRGEPWYSDRSGPSKYASKICNACGLPKLKPFHWGMRATMITYLLNQPGANIREIQQLADHEDLQTTMLYHNTRTIQQQNAVNAIPKL
ncbi:tyrosine-type recombinase/integrase [Pseudoalteromonas ruthenica]|uniref:tyrosine-type recombinase/integrase n=1 Tax=Pseudoalteromonas ruthenica TaxID=151081 RepID=UPI00110BE3F0|nr:site-specific integrase [Pseudoalteromonas ruthenica]TMO97578.1 hypothetical protein CWC07_13940 [Pseudoalteromonas ruthenica]